LHREEATIDETSVLDTIDETGILDTIDETSILDTTVDESTIRDDTTIPDSLSRLG